MTQVGRGPGTSQAGRGPSSPGISASSWASPRAPSGVPRCSWGVRRTRAPAPSTPSSTRSSRRTTVSAVCGTRSRTGPTTACRPGPSSPYVPGRSEARLRVRVIRSGPVACTVSRGSPGRGRPDGALRATSLAYRPAATAATPTPSRVVTAAAVAVTGRTLPVSAGWGGAATGRTRTDPGGGVPAVAPGAAGPTPGSDVGLLRGVPRSDGSVQGAEPDAGGGSGVGPVCPVWARITPGCG